MRVKGMSSRMKPVRSWVDPTFGVWPSSGGLSTRSLSVESGRKAFVYKCKYFTRRLYCCLFSSNIVLEIYWQIQMILMNFITDDIDIALQIMWFGWVKNDSGVDSSRKSIVLSPGFSLGSPPLLNTQRLWIKDEAGRGETETWRKKVYKKDPSVGSCGMRCRFTCIKLVACPGRAQWAEALQQVRIEHKPLHPRVTQQPPKQKWETQILWIWVRKVNFFILSLLAARSLLGVVSSPASDAFYTFNR